MFQGVVAPRLCRVSPDHRPVRLGGRAGVAQKRGIRVSIVALMPACAPLVRTGRWSPPPSGPNDPAELYSHAGVGEAMLFSTKEQRLQ
jgi:hypothetical protein